jgi:zinc transport system ATP-binding protein
VTPVPALALDRVGFGYGETRVLDDVCLAVGPGEFWALIGPNGGGKSTLLKLALGLIQPDRGEVRVLGTAPTAARARVGYVPQFATFPRDFPLRVREVVIQGRLGRRSWWRPLHPNDLAVADAALEEAGVAGLARRSIGALSGGQLQRVLIARALAAEPALLLLDEPTAHVDTKAEDAFFGLLAELRKRMAIILVSHDVGLVSRHVGHIACLNRTLVWHGAVPLSEGVLARLYGASAQLVDHRCCWPWPRCGWGSRSPC